MKGLVICFFPICIFVSSHVGAQESFNFTREYFQQLDNTHDLDLPAWGPYSRRYAGISHIPDVKSGMRFDFFVAPGYWRNKVMIPTVRYESGYYPWNISPDYKVITYRYELEWKDKVYCDVTYFTVDTQTVLVKINTVNNSPKAQSLVMNLFANIEYPETYSLYKADTAADEIWYNALQYSDLGHKTKRLNDNLVYDGWLRDEIRSDQHIDGRLVGRNFGAFAGDSVTYELPVKNDYKQGSVTFVYRVRPGKTATFKMNGLGEEQSLFFKGTGEREMLTVNYDLQSPGIYKMKLVSEGTANIDLNGFLMSPRKNNSMKIVKQDKFPQPQITEDEKNKTVLLKYADADTHYGIAWNADNFFIRQVQHDTLEFYFKDRVPDHLSKIIRGNYKGHFMNIFFRPISMKPNSSQTMYALVTNGSKNYVENNLKKLASLKQRSFSEENQNFKGLLPGAAKYLLGQRLMQATALGNIMYPIYTQNQFIKHYPPGKWWAMLYTWDAGFNAIGMNDINKKTAAEYINTYTTNSKSQSAFIHHGTPLPVQLYALQDLYNRTQSKELLEYFYPRLKNFYDFLTGKFVGSTVRTFKSDLLKTWDYFYNSGGWDDYPPQHYITGKPIRASIAPVSTTAHAIRAGKILRMMAVQLNKSGDVKVYDKDIADFSKAILNNTWDKDAGYFSYLVHDKEGKPSHFFRDSTSGKNFNMGLDGAYPLLSGIVTENQKAVLLDKIFSPRHMWTNIGISVVDQSSPFYRNDGYWNGAVWMPHQWFMWKTMLDINRPDLAYKIAQTGLDTWKNETDESYHCYEHFQIETGRGAGWHQFGALSMPVVSWFNAYYKMGTITTGYEVMVNKADFNKDFTSLRAEISFDEATAAHERSIIIVMNPAGQYSATFGGKKIKINELKKGILQVELPAINNNGVLIVNNISGKK